MICIIYFNTIHQRYQIVLQHFACFFASNTGWCIPVFRNYYANIHTAQSSALRSPRALITYMLYLWCFLFLCIRHQRWKLPVARPDRVFLADSNFKLRKIRSRKNPEIFSANRRPAFWKSAVCLAGCLVDFWRKKIRKLFIRY